MPLNALRSPLKSLNNNVSVISPSKNRFIADERPDLPPPSATVGQPLEILALSPTKSSYLRQEDTEEAPQSRLVIEKLVLTNFKSYVGVQEVGPFHSSFSAVVGPNGSGKSNVIDSMLFVFGFRASKMRQAKLSELIHNSDKHQNLKFCSVDIHFQQVIDKQEYGENESPVEVVPDQGIVVTRKAHRNNLSEYFINGKKSNYTVVTTLLKEKGIDLDHKRFLILQGEVELIAQMKPKAERDNDDGLLEYLEDIIGTAQYKQKIEVSLLEVNSLNDVCVEKENRFELVEKEKDSLETEKDKALLFLKLERQLINQKSIYYQSEIYRNTQKSKQNLEEYNKLKQRLEEEKRINIELVTEIKGLETRFAESNKRVGALNKQINELQRLQRNIEKENVKHDEQKKNLTNRMKKSEKVIANTTTSLSHNNMKLQNWLNDQKEYDESLKELQQQLQVENTELEGIRLDLAAKTKPYNDKISKIQKELQPWNEKLNEKESQVKIAASNVDLIKNEFLNIDKEIDAKTNEMEKIIDQGKEKQQLLLSLRKEKAKISKQIEHGNKETKTAETKLQTMKENLMNLRLKSNEAKTSVNNSQNKSKVLSGLMRLQQSGRISGFHGRLGDLAVIDDKYDVAVSTACSQLDDMVVDTVETGQQCIDYLRSKSLGYARFICLDKLKKFNMNKMNTPMNIPRLFDLIVPKSDKFLPAFYNAMRDTLVADNLRQANSAAYGTGRRYRVVTLDGKLIDTSGTLSGGGNYVHRGGMKTKSNAESGDMYTEEDVRQLEHELTSKEKHFQSAQESLREMGNVLNDLKDRYPQVDLQISKVEMEMKSLTAELTSLTNIVEELNANKDAARKKIQQDLENAEKVVLLRKQELQQLQQGASSLENELKALEAKIMDIGGVKLKMQKSKVDGIYQKIEILNEKSSTALHSIKKLQNEIKRGETTLANNKKEYEASERELQLLDEQYNSKNKNTVELEKQIITLTDEKDNVNNIVEEIKQELDSRISKVNELKSTEIELENGIEKLEAVVKQEQRIINDLKSQWDHLELRDISHLISWMDLGVPMKKMAVNEQKKEKQNKKKRKRGIRKDGEINGENNGETNDVYNNDEENNDEENNDEENNDEDSEMDVDSDEEEDEEDENGEGVDENKKTGDQNDENEKIDDTINQYDAKEIEELKQLFKSTELPTFGEEQLITINRDILSRQIAKLENELENLRVDVDILEEYGKRATEYQHRKLDLNEAIARREELRNYVEEMKKNRLNEFMKGFYTISMTLKEMYQMITMGGNAELELVDSLDPFAEGILFSVMPPKKSWKNISNLSGGEKTLSSLALVFALHRYKPTPLYVMDEIDAALDFRNVSIVANYIKERTKNAQFIVISLRNNMFELAQRLVGIYKVENMTRSVTLKNKDLVNGKQREDENNSQKKPSARARLQALVEASKLSSQSKSLLN